MGHSSPPYPLLFGVMKLLSNPWKLFFSAFIRNFARSVLHLCWLRKLPGESTIPVSFKRYILLEFLTRSSIELQVPSLVIESEKVGGGGVHSRSGQKVIMARFQKNYKFASETSTPGLRMMELKDVPLRIWIQGNNGHWATRGSSCFQHRSKRHM